MKCNKTLFSINERCTDLNLKRKSVGGYVKDIKYRSKYSSQYQKLNQSSPPLSMVNDHEILQSCKYLDKSRSMIKVQYTVYPMEDLESAWSNS